MLGATGAGADVPGAGAPPPRPASGGVGAPVPRRSGAVVAAGVDGGVTVGAGGEGVVVVGAEVLGGSDEGGEAAADRPGAVDAGREAGADVRRGGGGGARKEIRIAMPTNPAASAARPPSTSLIAAFRCSLRE